MPFPRKHANHAQRQRAYILRQKAAQAAAIKAKNMPAGSAIPTMPSTARWKALSRQAQTILQTLKDEMEAYRDERSEAWQESDKADAFQEAVDRVDEALESALNLES
jgi:ABC-type Fe3+ transport system substrate-binding protein